MRVRLERRHVRLKDFSLILESTAGEHTFDDLDALAHHGRRTNFLAFAFANLFHEDLGRSQTKQKAIASQILHHPRFHRDLYRMTRVGRNDAPPQLNASSLGRDDGQNRGRGARLKRMLPPPGISLRNPEGVEPRVFTGLRHGNGFAHRLHAELQNTNVEWNRDIAPDSDVPDLSASLSPDLSTNVPVL